MTKLVFAPSGYSRSIRYYRRIGLALILLVCSTFGIWAATAPLSSAVVASGHFEVDGNTKKVQHQAGGIISEILVHEGQRVREGETLLQLDPTTARSNLQIIQHQLGELWMNAARLQAEREGAADFAIPEQLNGNATAASMQSLYQSQLQLLKAQHEARLGQQDQLTERVNQLDAQIIGTQTQVDAKRHEHELLTGELDGLHGLLKQNLIPVSRVNDLERNVAQLDGEIGQLQSSIAEMRGKIAETKLQILSVDQMAVSDANKELQEVESKINELIERQLEAKDVMSRLDIRAPRTGFVHQLSVHTVGGVIASGEVLMMIVPELAPLTIEVRIAPQDVDSIHVGDKALVRIVGLNRSRTPDLDATVELIGADLVEDAASRIAYYPVRVHLDPGQAERLDGAPLVPGMPVDAFITTSDRTFADYIMEPVMDRMSRAIREK